MSTLPIAKVLTKLFEFLFTASSSVAAEKYSRSLATIAEAYPEIWSESLLLQFQSLSPSADSHKWICLLTHLGSVSPLTDVQPLIEICVTSIHSVDIDIRRWSAGALKAISVHHSEAVLASLLTSLEIYSINFEIFDLLSTCMPSDEVLTYLVRLLTEESDLVLSLYLRPLCATIVSVIRSKNYSIGNVVALWELVSPLCWSQTLISSSSTADPVRASAALLCALPSVSVPSLHSVQTALMRAAIHARTRDQLVASIEAIHFLLLAKKILHDDETVASFVPILIDLGIAMGLSWTGAVQQSMLKLWADMSDRGIAFLRTRVHASRLSLGDQFVCLVFLAATKTRDIELDSLVATNPSEPYIKSALLSLIMSSGSSSVPVIDWVIAQSTIEDPSSQPSSLKHYWFFDSSSATGPSMRDVCEQAQQCIPKLKSFHFFQNRLIVALRRLPINGLDVLMANLVHPINKESLAGEIAAWHAIHTDSCKVLSEKVCVSFTATLLSNRVLKKLDKTQVLRAFSLFEKTIEFAPNAEEVLATTFADTFVVTIGFEKVGQLVGHFSKFRFPEFLRLYSEMKKKKSLFSNNDFWLCASRIALGCSARFAPAQVLPLLKPMYIDPCLDTLQTEKSVGVLKCTLIAIADIFSAHTDPPIELVESVLNVINRRDLAEQGLLALEALANASSSIPPSVYSRGVKLALDFLLVDQTIVANSIAALIKHSEDIWLGLGQLARAAQLAGLNGPDPLRRRALLKVFSQLAFPEGPMSISRLEFMLVVVPRLRDGETRDLARNVWSRICDEEEVSFSKIDFADITHFTLLAVEGAVTDTCLESSLYLLDILNEVLSTRGADAGEAARLTGLMIQRADQVPFLRRKLLDCVHTLSALHLDTTLRNLIARRNVEFSTGELSAIASLVKVRKLCIGFLNFVGGLMVANEEFSPHAASALLVALNLDDPTVNALVRKHAAVLLGTIWIYGRNNDSSQLEAAWSRCVSSSPEKYMQNHASSVATFLLPFASVASPLLIQLVPAVSPVVLVQLRDAFVSDISFNAEKHEQTIPALAGLCAVQNRDVFLITSAVREQVLQYLDNDPPSEAGIYESLCLLESLPPFASDLLTRKISSRDTFVQFLKLAANSNDPQLDVEIHIRAKMFGIPHKEMPQVEYVIFTKYLAKYLDGSDSFSPGIIGAAADMAIGIANACKRKNIVDSILHVIKNTREEETRCLLLESLGRVVV